VLTPSCSLARSSLSRFLALAPLSLSLCRSRSLPAFYPLQFAGAVKPGLKGADGGSLEEALHYLEEEEEERERREVREVIMTGPPFC